MMRSLTSSVLLAAVLYGGPLVAAVNFEDFYELDEFSKHCGTHAVLLCLAERGLADLEDFDVVDAFLDPDGDGKTTFARIINCLDRYGVRAVGYRGELSDLQAGGTYILQIKLRGQPHFSYAQIDAESCEATIFDPALGDKSQQVSLSGLGKVWTGNFIEVVTSQSDEEDT